MLDDNFLQPQPGTSPGDHLVSGLVPLALLGLAAWAYPRLRGGRRGALALVFGVLGIAAGIEGFHYAREVGPSGDDFTGLLAIPAGLMLLGLGAVTLWRTRRTDGSLLVALPAPRAARRRGRSSSPLLVLIAVYGYVTTHVGRAVVPANHLARRPRGREVHDQRRARARGLVRPVAQRRRRDRVPGPQRPAEAKTRMLARHGYGVLLFDRRGEGESEGEPNSWGWGGEADIKAAIAYLQRRPDVDPDRIGGIGLSVGGEMMIEAAAETDELAAVVSEGAGRAVDDRGHGRGRLRPGQVHARIRAVRGQDRGGRGVLQPGAAGEPEGPRREGRRSRCC